jgi:hypothetical protein
MVQFAYLGAMNGTTTHARLSLLRQEFVALIGGISTEVNIGSPAPAAPQHPKILRGRLGPSGVDFAFNRVEGVLKVARTSTMTEIDIRL